MGSAKAMADAGWRDGSRDYVFSPRLSVSPPHGLSLSSTGEAGDRIHATMCPAAEWAGGLVPSMACAVRWPKVQSPGSFVILSAASWRAGRADLQTCVGPRRK